MISIEKHNSTLLFTIETDESNSLDRDFFKELIERINEAETDSKCKTIILTAKNQKFFSNGFKPELFIGKTYEEIYSDVALSVTSCGRILFCKKPIVSAINGYAMGVGAVMAIFSDYRVMVTKGARIGFPEGLIGLNFPSTTAKVLVELVGIQKARELLYGAKALKPEDAIGIGLIDEICDTSNLIQISLKWCKKFENMAMESVVGLRVAFRDVLHLHAVQMESRDKELLAKAIFSENGQEGLRSIVEKRRPVWKELVDEL